MTNDFVQLEIWKMMKDVCFLSLPLAKCGGWWWWRCQSALGFFYFFCLFFFRWFQDVPKFFMFTMVFTWSCHNGSPKNKPFLGVSFWDWNHQLEMIIVHRASLPPRATEVNPISPSASWTVKKAGLPPTSRYLGAAVWLWADMENGRWNMTTVIYTPGKLTWNSPNIDKTLVGL